MLSSVMVRAKTRRRRTDPSAILPRRFPPAYPRAAPTARFGSGTRFPRSRSTRRIAARARNTPPRDDPRARAFGADRATTFLFENFPEGLRDDAAEDAAAGAAYLSDAAWFASAGRALAVAGFAFGGGGFADANANGTLTDGNGAPADPGAVGELVAGSVATRGLLFAPHPSRRPFADSAPSRGRRAAKAHRAAVANLREVRGGRRRRRRGLLRRLGPRRRRRRDAAHAARHRRRRRGGRRARAVPAHAMGARGRGPGGGGRRRGLRGRGARRGRGSGTRAARVWARGWTARAGDEDEEEQEDIEDADDF